VAIFGLDLFSGIGGITTALKNWVIPVAYCESDSYAQSVLLSRMSERSLPVAPIWSDVKTLKGGDLPKVEIIYGGFPCQDISVANTSGKGLDGKRSGLFGEIVRLTEEIKPTFVFLENVPNIRTRGLETVLKEFTALGYDCRWTIVSASAVGANHKRDRWFFLAHSRRSNGWCEFGENNKELGQGGQAPDKRFGASYSNKIARPSAREKIVADSDLQRFGRQTNATKKENTEGDREKDGRSKTTVINSSNAERKPSNTDLQRCDGKDGKTTGENESKEIRTECIEGSSSGGICANISDSKSVGVQGLRSRGKQESFTYEREKLSMCKSERRVSTHWEVEPDLGRVVDELPFRVDRIKCLGNAVVPFQAKEAFKKLMGLKG